MLNIYYKISVEGILALGRNQHYRSLSLVIIDFKSSKENDIPRFIPQQLVSMIVFFYIILKIMVIKF
jgi:hypothetical protein